MGRNLLPQEDKTSDQHTHEREIAERGNHRVHRSQHRLVGDHIRKGSRNEIQRDKANRTDNQRPHPENPMFGQVGKQLSASHQHTQQEQRGSLEKRPYPHAHNRLNNWPSQRLDLTIAQKSGCERNGYIRCYEHAKRGCRHIVRIYHRIEKLAEFESWSIRIIAAMRIARSLHLQTNTSTTPIIE